VLGTAGQISGRTHPSAWVNLVVDGSRQLLRCRYQVFPFTQNPFFKFLPVCLLAVLLQVDFTFVFLECQEYSPGQLHGWLFKI